MSTAHPYVAPCSFQPVRLVGGGFAPTIPEGRGASPIAPVACRRDACLGDTLDALIQAARADAPARRSNETGCHTRASSRGEAAVARPARYRRLGYTWDAQDDDTYNDAEPTRRERNRQAAARSRARHRGNVVHLRACLAAASAEIAALRERLAAASVEAAALRETVRLLAREH
jgi:hypothetical protein